MFNLFRKFEKNENEAITQETQFDQVFIVTYGRSGSTLLQKIINSIPGYMIKGENNGALFHIFRSIKALKDASHNHGSREPKLARVSSASDSHPWYGIGSTDLDSYSTEAINAFVRNIIKPDQNIRAYGFKEIRYFGNIQNITEILEFMRNNFSNPCFIFNYRNWNDVANSRWWAKQDPDDLKKRLQWFEEECDKFIQNNTNRTIILKYDDYSNDVTELKRLFDFLGEDFDKEKIQQIMSQKLTH
ncbi:hypothetical protein HKX42_08885 [Salinisphaera sp. USBA-960]|nr:hypothetical protein [Salifodinibacter halophilus]NNC26988.1 hypothetical protein [Salifodinibacter halophilus]